ncbi:Immunity protein [Kluyvera sp. M-M157-B]|nr:hypothetical protein WP8S18E06_40540 [Klebsiella sp. WP8-S18-ESBL-06]
MKKTLLVTALFCSLLTAGITGIFIVNDVFPDTASVCRLDFSRKALLRVKEDYLRGRFPHWYREKSTLGTLTPELIFGEVTIEDDEYRVPFVAKGPLAKLARIGFVDCETMDVEYIAGK